MKLGFVALVILCVGWFWELLDRMPLGRWFEVC